MSVVELTSAKLTSKFRDTMDGLLGVARFARLGTLYSAKFANLLCIAVLSAADVSNMA